MPSVKKTEVRDLELTEEYTSRDRKVVTTTQRTSFKQSYAKKPCKKDKCGNVRQKVTVPSPHIKPTHACVEKTIPCHTYSCDDVCISENLKPTKVGVKDVKVIVKPSPVKVGPDMIDVKLKYQKPKCSNPKVNVNIKPSCPVMERQKVFVEVHEQKYSKDGPIVKVHCPTPSCYTMKPEVTFNVVDPGDCCMQDPEISVTYVDSCKKNVNYKADSY